MINHSGILVGRNECTAGQYHTSAYRLRAAIASCPEPCNSIRFISNKLVYPAFSIKPCDHIGGNVVLVYQENFQKYSEEKYVYEFITFLASIGGYLGLLTGASVFTVGEFIATTIFWIFRT
ncbi:uncharacterized protein LOC111699933 [Eurytemora carolleeae]|uniref:uncharacterized protein LOC111699933 n=1 Tax=Eurytemora carolleeae TaxID=1294199 RepID=UPI000C77F8C8|nr:uncharacterized protein LOC111699933 [Eurytemora carolleeae]XP_023326493.1 uncharacterized protein LOC111699933 [Eurytemora carolleeae]|eukprot:XP_023326492.1 uncharacterized protein LOC111699933 [Eurytemora affinis]